MRKNDTVKNQLATAIANNKKQIGASLSSAYKKVLSAQLSLSQAQTKGPVRTDQSFQRGFKAGSRNDD